MRRFAVTAAVALALCAGVSAQAASLVPLGRAVGIQMTTAGMLVADLAEVDTPGGKATPAKDAGLLPGDVICRIDGRDIASSADFLAAVDAADVVLMNSRLSDVPAAIRLSRATLRNIHENLFWAFCYNLIGIPLAAGVFISLLGWKLNPMFGAAAMSLSSFCVVSNALRLNLFRLRDGRHDRALHPVTLPGIAAQPGAKVLTMRIDGMMCAHCEARVKAALEAVEGVQSAAASHEAGTAVVTLKADADENALKPLLKAVVEENDYEVKGFDK